MIDSSGTSTSQVPVGGCYRVESTVGGEIVREPSGKGNHASVPRSRKKMDKQQPSYSDIPTETNSKTRCNRRQKEAQSLHDTFAGSDQKKRRNSRSGRTGAIGSQYHRYSWGRASSSDEKKRPKPPPTRSWEGANLEELARLILGEER